MKTAKDLFWSKLVGRYPHFAESGANLTPKGTRDLLNAGFDAGYATALVDAEECEAGLALARRLFFHEMLDGNDAS